MRGYLSIIFMIIPLISCSDKYFSLTIEKVNTINQETKSLTESKNNEDFIESGLVHIHHQTYGGGKAIINDHGENIPIEKDHFILNSQSIQMKLREISSEINAQTDIPVDLIDDSPGQMLSQNSHGGGTDQDCRMAPAFQGRLTKFLENLGSYCDLTWRYQNGRLKLSLYESQSYRLYALPSSVTVKSSMMSMGLTPNSSANASTNSVSATGQSLDTKIDLESKMDPWKELKETIATLVKPGVVEVSPSQQTLIVVSRHSAHQLVKKFIEDINRRQLRQVDFTIQVLNVTTNENIDLGISLNSLYNQLRGQYQLNQLGPTALSMTGAAALGLTVQNNSITGKTNPAATSSAIVSALQTLGHVATRDTLTVSARDGLPAPVTVARQLGYLASASSTTNSVASVGGLQEATLTIGLTMSLLPIIMDQGQILLQYSFGLSSLNSLTSITSNGITLQTPDINVRSSMQEAVVTSGDAIVLLGYQQDSLNQQNQGLPGIASDYLGGLVSGGHSINNSHSALVIIITPKLRDIKTGGL